jgi:hypothetical protein
MYLEQHIGIYIQNTEFKSIHFYMILLRIVCLFIFIFFLLKNEEIYAHFIDLNDVGL